MDRSQVGIIEAEQKGFFLQIQQVLVRGDEQWNFGQGGLGEEYPRSQKASLKSWAKSCSPARSRKTLVSSARGLFGLVAIDFRHAAPEILRLLFSRQLAG